MAEDVPVKNSSVAAHQEGIEISAESSSVQPAAPQKETIPSIARFIKYLSAYVNHSITQSFTKIGRFVARRPYAVIIATLAVTAVLGTFIVVDFEEEKDLEDLYTPKRAQSFKDREFVLSQYSNQPMEVRILITRNVNLRKETSCDKRNLLRNKKDARAVLLEYMALYDLILDQKVEYKGQSYTLADVCHYPSNSSAGCKRQSLLDVWGYDENLLLADEDVVETVHKLDQIGGFKGVLGIQIPIAYILGKNKQIGACNGNIEVFQMTFFLENDLEDVKGESLDAESAAWSQKLVETVRKRWKNSENLVGFVSSFNGVNVESQKAIARDLQKIPAGFVIMIAFSHWVLFKNNAAACKSHLATGSALSVVMSMIGAFGLAQALGVKLNLVVQTLPFILFGLGLDDTFVIMGAYHASSPLLTIEERMASAMGRAGSSILVTSLTDMAAFAVGGFTDLPVLLSFSIYAFLGIMFDFIYQVTFFTALVVLDARREERARHGRPHLGIQCGWGQQDSSRSTHPQILVELQDANQQDNKKVPESGSSKEISDRNEFRSSKLLGRGEYDPSKPSLSTRVAGEWLPSVTLHPLGVAIVLMIEVAAIAIAGYGCTRVEMDIRFRDWFVPDSSYLKTAVYIEKDYFAGDQQPFSVYTKAALDGQDFFNHQDTYLELIAAVKKDTYVASVPPVITWYEDFLQWLKSASPYRTELIDGNRPPNATAFTDWVQVYLNDPAGAYFRDNIVFGENGIVSTRIDCYTQDIVDGKFAVATVDSIRNSVQEAAPVFDPLAYTLTFLFFDGFKVIVEETVRNAAMAASAVLVITMIVLASFTAAVIVTMMIVLTDIMLFGFLWYMGLTFNTVTAISMVLAIGIAVDYSSHIAHSFLVLEGSRKERARGAMHHIGGEVLDGAFTTWLSIAVMGFAEHYVFRAFFRTFFTIVVVGLWHGLVLLPVVLRLIGPPHYLPSAHSDGCN